MKFKKFNFKIIKSTNDTAARIIKKTNYKFGMVVAEKQFSGRGQYGRKWISYKGNLFASFFHPFDENKFSIERVTKLNCNLVKQTLSKYIKNKINFVMTDTKIKSGTDRIQKAYENLGKDFDMGMGLAQKRTLLIILLIVLCIKEVFLFAY